MFYCGREEDSEDADDAAFQDALIPPDLFAPASGGARHSSSLSLLEGGHSQMTSASANMFSFLPEAIAYAYRSMARSVCVCVRRLI